MRIDDLEGDVAELRSTLERLERDFRTFKQRTEREFRNLS
jgi:molecular chaperone GrpE (heat shock protein)